jgi:hypothetical protein
MMSIHYDEEDEEKTNIEKEKNVEKEKEKEKEFNRIENTLIDTSCNSSTPIVKENFISFLYYKFRSFFNI